MYIFPTLSKMSRTLSPVPNLSPTPERHNNHNEGYFTQGLGNFLTSGLNHHEIHDIRTTGRKHITSPIAVDDHLTTLLDYEKVRPESRQEQEQAMLNRTDAAKNVRLPRNSPSSTSSTIYMGGDGSSSNDNRPGSSSLSSSPRKVRSPPKGQVPRESLESVGGLSKWEMTNAPVHFQHHQHEHYTGPIESTQGGIFGYLGRLQQLALAPPSNVPVPKSPIEGGSRRAQEGELTKTGIGNYIGDETAPHPSSPVQKSQRLYAFGEGNTAKSTFLPSTSPTRMMGNGTFDTYNVGSGLYQFIADKGDPPRTRKHVPSELEKLGINHPGAVGQHQPDPSTKVFHKRIFADHRGNLAEEGGLGIHLYTNDPDTHRNFSTVGNSSTPTRSTLEDPVYHKSQLSPRSGGIAAYNMDKDEQLAPPSDDHLPVFPGEKSAKRRPVTVFENRDFQGDAVAELLKEEEAEEAITRQLAELDVQLARAGLATTRSAPIGEAGPLNVTVSTANQNAINAVAHLSQRRHKLSNRWHEERNHTHVKFGTSSPAAAAVASSGRIPLDGTRLARARTALRSTLPKDNQAALLALKHRLMLRDGDADGILTDEELLRTLIDLSPSNISASDVGHMARYLREHGRILRSNAQTVADASGDDHGQAVRRAHHKNFRVGSIWVEDENDLDDYEKQAHQNNEDDESVEIVTNDGKFIPTKRDRRIRKAQEENDKFNNTVELDAEKDGIREEGILIDAMANWLLGLEGIGKTNASPQIKSGNLVGILAHPMTEKGNNSTTSPSKNDTDNNGDETSSRLDFASKDMAYTTFRVAWEKKHGAPARKEINNDLMEGTEGPTWTKANPTPFKVLHLMSSPPSAQSMV